LSDCITGLRSGNIGPKEFQERLQFHNIPMTQNLSNKIRRINAGDSKITYHELGREIFKKPDSNDNSFLYPTASDSSNLYYKYKKRAQSPEVKAS